MTGRDEPVQLPAELEGQLRDLHPTCEARIRSLRGRKVECRNEADFVVHLTGECGHTMHDPVCEAHHDLIHFAISGFVFACPHCHEMNQPAKLDCEPLR